MAFILTADQEVSVSVEFTDSHGNVAAVDGVPVWAASDDTILGVLAADDGMSAVIFAQGPDGQAQVSVEADADLGAGSTTLLGLMDIQVVAGQAVSAVLTPATPVMHVHVQPLSP